MLMLRCTVYLAAGSDTGECEKILQVNREEINVGVAVRGSVSVR